MKVIFILWGANPHSLIAHQRFWGNLLLPSSGRKGKVKSKTSINFCPISRSHFPEDGNVFIRCESLRSKKRVYCHPMGRHSPLFLLWFMHFMPLLRMMYLKSSIPYVSCLDGCYWWMMPVFLPPPITVSRKNFFFPFRYAAWSLTLWCYERRFKSGWSLADVWEREGMFSPATNSAAAEKLWSCRVLPFSDHWLLGSRGEWMCSNWRTIQLLGGTLPVFSWSYEVRVYIRILCELRRKVIVSESNCFEWYKNNWFCFVIKMIKST
jgi:hypothetical protein